MKNVVGRKKVKKTKVVPQRKPHCAVKSSEFKAVMKSEMAFRPTGSPV